MVNRLYAKDLLGFKSIDIEFKSGLIVITGPSGAGKSVLIGSLLANFGLANQEAKLCEVEVEKPKNLKSDAYEIEDQIVIKALKKDRVRFFIDGQNISKKELKELFKEYISYISVRDKSGFESEKLIELVDNYLAKKDTKHSKKLLKFSEKFNYYKSLKEKLSQTEKREKDAIQRVEFLKFEIEKIEKIEAKEGEYEELLVVKKQLSKIDKINEIANRVEEIFGFEDSIYKLFELINKDSSYINDAMNQLRGDFDDISALSEDLADINIEELLDRLEQLSGLIKRFGSIDEALKYLDGCKNELNSFNTIQEDASALKGAISSLNLELESLTDNISKSRKKASKEIEDKLEHYLKELKLPRIELNFCKVELYNLGSDELSLSMGSTKVESLSGGEFNRVRLALLTVATSDTNSRGVIILDEIDANVSGDESIAIANMISKLSKSFQIFAISHQPHLSSKAKQHILVTKDSKESYIKVLNSNERVDEIARIVGGENFNKEALEFAKGLF